MCWGQAGHCMSIRRGWPEVTFLRCRLSMLHRGMPRCAGPIGGCVRGHPPACMPFRADGHWSPAAELLMIMDYGDP